jgi:hypothetical protein
LAALCACAGTPDPVPAPLAPSPSPAPAFRARPGEKRTTQLFEARPEELIFGCEDRQEVLRALRRFAAPGQWQASGASLTYSGSSLAVRHSPEVVDAAAELTRILRSERERRIRISARLRVIASEDLKILANVPPIDGGFAGTFDRASLSEILRRWDEGGAWQSALPPMTLYHGQLRTASLQNQAAYVAGWNQDDPVVKTDVTGLVVRTGAVVNGSPAQGMLLSFELELVTSLDAPPGFLRVTFGEKEAELPGHVRIELSDVASMQTDQSLLILMRNPQVGDARRPILALTLDAQWLD